MRVVRIRTLWVNFCRSHCSRREVPSRQAPLDAALICTLSTGSQSSNQARWSRRASSFPLKAMSEQQYQVLQPVQITSTSLKTYTGDVILSDCFLEASVTEKDSDGVILGIESNEGPVALQDFSLGQVRHAHIHIFLGAQWQSLCQGVVWSAAALQQLCELSPQQTLVDDASLGLAGSGHSSRYLA